MKITAEAAHSEIPDGIPAVPDTDGPFQKPMLAYGFAAMEPHIDARTMQIHYERHHAGYVRNLNVAVIETEMATMSIEDILKTVSRFSMEVPQRELNVLYLTEERNISRSQFISLATPGRPRSAQRSSPINRRI